MWREKGETRANDFDPLWRAGFWCPFNSAPGRGCSTFSIFIGPASPDARERVPTAGNGHVAFCLPRGFGAFV
jgi:hypothetical protein